MRCLARCIQQQSRPEGRHERKTHLVPAKRLFRGAIRYCLNTRRRTVDASSPSGMEDRDWSKFGIKHRADRPCSTPVHEDGSS
ncbi:hypothetical protein PGTUg99_014203 [Puccinia graminis f. sp. tritici]|uniref:Uncharacterized protein n=1 Tax=Puccinia graminis f. sp. tritici TaxID=56615 RepID=A0A5B0NEQ8_PUCGR|nr:hypothetical protein PGTUg99_014203 [Puccinia graminis f. sp. tritici]